MKKDILLNSVFVKNRIQELEIKQWWLAEQIGVDRKTVSRWLNGKVKTIQRDNAQALAQILKCQIEDLTVSDKTEQLASKKDQRAAAKLLKSSSLIDRLGPIGEWDVIESLLKATILPDLPKSILGEMYNLLAVAAWRQSKIDEASEYIKKAEEIAVKTGDKAVLAGALLNKANVYSWRGQTSRSVEIYEKCIELEKYIAPKSLGAAYSNIGATFAESGNLARAIEFQLKSIERFKLHGSPTNLSISHCHLAMIYLKKDDLQEAQTHCDLSLRYAQKDEYKRGLQMSKLIQAEIEARKSNKILATRLLEEALDGFEKLGIIEGLNFEFAGRISRLNGRFVDAEKYLKKGIGLSGEFPLYQASIYFELALLYRYQERETEAIMAARRAVEIFTRAEAPLNVEAVQKSFDFS